MTDAQLTGLDDHRSYENSAEEIAGSPPADDQKYTAAEWNRMRDTVDQHAPLIDGLSAKLRGRLNALADLANKLEPFPEAVLGDFVTFTDSGEAWWCVTDTTDSDMPDNWHRAYALDRTKQDYSALSDLPVSGRVLSQLEQSISGRYTSEHEFLTGLADIDAPANNSIYYVHHVDSVSDESAGYWQFKEFRNKDTANGGTVYDPDQSLDDQGAGSESDQGCFVRILPDGKIWAHYFGQLYLTDDTAAFTKWCAAISSEDGMHGAVKPGRYIINGDLGFRGSKHDIYAVGCTFITTASTGTMFKFNLDATSDESIFTHSIYWVGGDFRSNAEVNQRIGIDTTGVTRGGVCKVFGQGFGGTFIEQSPLDSVNLSQINAFDNERHVRVPDYLTTAGNPQGWTLSEFAFSRHGDAGVLIDGCCNAVNICDGFFIGSRSIVGVTRPTANTANAQELQINNVTMEQADNTDPYIVIHGTDGTLYSLNITGCGFAGALGGGACKILSASAVAGLQFSGNFVAYAAPGWMDLGVGCRGVDIGINTFITPDMITYACDRREIRVYPYVRPVNTNGVSGIIDNESTPAAGSAVVDVAAALGIYYPDLIHPYGYDITAYAKDTAPDTTCNLAYITDTGVGSGHKHKGIQVDLAYHNPNAWASVSGFVEAATDGTIARRVQIGSQLTAVGKIKVVYT